MKKVLKPLFILLIVVSAGSCASRKTLVQTELYFGLSQNNGNLISDSAWNVFMNVNVSKVFSKGFTVIHSEVKWVDKEHRKMHFRTFTNCYFCKYNASYFVGQY